MRLPLFAAVPLLATVALAADHVPTGPAVGSTIPALEVKDLNGKSQSLSSLTGPKGLMPRGAELRHHVEGELAGEGGVDVHVNRCWSAGMDEMRLAGYAAERPILQAGKQIHYE